MRRTATILLVLTAQSALFAADPLRISLAESPVAGLRERVETHLAQEYDCVVISRSRPAAVALEQSIDRMKTLQDAALPPDELLAADACAWVSAWDEFLRITRQLPANGIRELSYEVADLTRSGTRAASLKREQVPERSEFERTLAQRIAAELGLPRASPARASADKSVTVAVLPFERHEARNQYTTKNSLDSAYLSAEASVLNNLPPGASILSRDRIRDILAEHNLAGLDEASLMAIAHLLPAQALLCGTVTRRQTSPQELRLDLHLLQPRSGAMLAAWEGRCADAAGLADLAATGSAALMAATWKPVTTGTPSAVKRLREALFLLSRANLAAAWGLARDQPELSAPLLKGLLRQAGNYCVWMKPIPENPDAFLNRTLQETSAMLDDLLKGQTQLADDGADEDAVRWPDLIRGEIKYWLGEYAESERLCRTHLSERPDCLPARAELVLAWALFKQGRYGESRSFLRRVEAKKGLMWWFPGLGGAWVGYWANNLNIALAEQSGDLSEHYQRVKAKMRARQFFVTPDIKLYLQAVEQQEGPEGAIRDLSSLLIFNTEQRYDEAQRALKTPPLYARCTFSDLSPAYAVRGHCYEQIGDKQRALDDYALYLKIAGFYGYHPPRANLSAEDARLHAPYVTAAVRAVQQLEAEGLKPKNEWRTIAETRPFPSNYAIYLVPVGTCDPAWMSRLLRETEHFIGARLEQLPAVSTSDLKTTTSKNGMPCYDSRNMVESVLRKLAVPDDAVQLVVATSEVFGIPGWSNTCHPISYDGGNTVLLPVRDPPPRHVILYALHYRYVPKQDEGWRMDAPEVSWFLRNTTYCLSPCIFAGGLNTLSGEVKGICPRCQEIYRQVDFGALNREAVAALKAQGVKIVPAKRP